MLRWIDIIKFVRYGNPEPPLKIERSDEEWKHILTPEQYRVSRQKGTEPPSVLNDISHPEHGNYLCICCSNVLFTSYEKFNSGTGWPSFTQPWSVNAIKYLADHKLSYKRVEVMCNVCDSHLGHVFPDGPEPSGLRYCINNASLHWKVDLYSTAILGGGCFWSFEAIFKNVKGIEKVTSGYSGGKLKNPSYREVSSGLSGHAEVIKLRFDPKVISYEEILKVFFSIHNPALIEPDNKQYPHYKSIILYADEGQKQTAEKIKNILTHEKGKSIATEIAPFEFFYPAEEKHQKYYSKNPSLPYCENVITPKLNQLRKDFPELLKF